MAVFRKKNNPPPRQEQEQNPSQGFYGSVPALERLEKEKKTARMQMTFFAVLFALLFGWICFYFT